jgi:hypothetical protein
MKQNGIRFGSFSSTQAKKPDQLFHNFSLGALKIFRFASLSIYFFFEFLDFSNVWTQEFSMKKETGINFGL